jgi:hypothetical protein
MLEVGQVLTMKIRFKNSGETAEAAHPCLVVAINEEYVEIAQFSSLKGKEYKSLFKSNKIVCCDDPKETVLHTDSFVQLDNRFTVENFVGLENFRKQTDKLSSVKLAAVLSAYREYHACNAIDDNRIVHMTETDILDMNK